MLLEEVYRNAKVVNSGKALTTVNEFTDQLPALRPEVLIEAAQAVVRLMDLSVDKIVTEEDKGAPLATAVSLLTGIPMAMARWYPYSLGVLNEQMVNVTSEYFQGKMYLNGIDPGDRIAIVDDTLSTGGAVIALVEAITACNADVVDIVCIVEKIGNEGFENVKMQTGHAVKTLIKILVSKDRVKVI